MIIVALGEYNVEAEVVEFSSDKLQAEKSRWHDKEWRKFRVRVEAGDVKRDEAELRLKNRYQLDGDIPKSELNRLMESIPYIDDELEKVVLGVIIARNNRKQTKGVSWTGEKLRHFKYSWIDFVAM